MPNIRTIPKSAAIKGFEWLGARIPYREKGVTGDTFPLTWADDGEIYASAGDPQWGDSKSGLDIERISGGAEDHAIAKVNEMRDFVGYGGSGPKPTGMICVDGILYLAVQNLRGGAVAPHSLRSQHGSDAHIIYSSSKGDHWAPSFQNIGQPMFPGHFFGGPAFINFGRNNENARDGYVYAISSDQWDNGSNLRLGRAPAGRIASRAAWEWVCAYGGDGAPAWHGDLCEAIPVLSLHRSLGAPEMAYLAGIKRYLLLSWRLNRDFSHNSGTELLVFESPEPWGPFSLVFREECWEDREFNPYAPRLPLKWMEPDGATGWLLFSGNWSGEGYQAGYYRASVRKFRLKL
ncbi:MAG: DUF4185 domain-containing protein [Clostridiales bacterium]|jgi:hypothetical protein|nr:DUF4185 domain-containing protein [Clostridiales bacterium]